MNSSHDAPENHLLDRPRMKRNSSQDLLAAQPPSRAPSPSTPMKAASKKTRKLILCFDGTGNKFRGDDSDSNILKIFRMLDRTANDQCKRNCSESNEEFLPAIRSLLPAWYRHLRDLGKPQSHFITCSLQFLVHEGEGQCHRFFL